MTTRLFSQMDEASLPMGTVDPLDLQPRPPTSVDQFSSTAFLDQIDKLIHRCVRPYVPPGLRIQYCVIPEEVELIESETWQSLSMWQWLQKQFEGHWPPWPDRQLTSVNRYNNQFWSISMDRLAEATDCITALVGLRMEQVYGTRLGEAEVRLLGFTHQRDIQLIVSAECRPLGSHEKPGDPPELFARLIVEKRKFGIQRRTAAMVMDDISVDVDAGEIDYRNVMYNGSEQGDDAGGYDGYDDDGYVTSGSYCEYRDKETGKIYTNYDDEEEDEPAPTPSKPVPIPKPKVLGSWEQCKLQWKNMGGLQNQGYRGHGWYFLPPAVGDGSEGMPMLPDESYVVGMFTLVERLMRRISFLWCLHEWLSDADKDAGEVFGDALPFNSLEIFVQDRYASELLILAAALRSEWIERLAQAEGLMSCLYFNWLDREEERIRLIRCNEVYSRAFEGTSSNSFHRRLATSLRDNMRGTIKATVANWLSNYVETNVRARCEAWRSLLQINDETGEAEALAKCGDLGPTVEDLIPALWAMLDEISNNHPIQMDASPDMESKAKEPPAEELFSEPIVVDFCI